MRQAPAREQAFLWQTLTCLARSGAEKASPLLAVATASPFLVAAQVSLLLAVATASPPLATQASLP